MIAVSTLTSPIQKELGSLFATEAHTDSDIRRYINSALNYIYNYQDWDWSRRVETFWYTTPWTEATIPYMQKIYGARIDGEYMRVLNNTEWFNQSDHTGCVGIYWDKFISDTAGIYQVIYMPPYSPISSTTTEINIPPNFIDVINYVALHYAYKDERDYENAQRLLNAANAVLDKVNQRTGDQTPLQETRIWSNFNF